MLLHLRQLQISFINDNNNWPKPLDQQGTSINNILYSLKKSHQIKTKLNKIGLYYVKQLTDHNNTTVLSWFQLPHNLQLILRGKKLKWYEIITNKIQTLLSSNNSNLITPNLYTYNNQLIDKASWVMKKKQDIYFIGKISSVINQIATINH